jgi:hypothetical protein
MEQGNEDVWISDYGVWIEAVKEEESLYYRKVSNWTNCLSLSIIFSAIILVSRDSLVGIATGYGLGGQGIESRWCRDFLHPARPTLEPNQRRIIWVPGLFPRGKAVRAWR